MSFQGRSSVSVSCSQTLWVSLTLLTLKWINGQYSRLCFWAHAVVSWGWYPIMIPFHVEISPDYLSPSTICIMFFLGSSTWCNVTDLQNLPPAVSFKYQLLFQHFVALFHFLCLHQIQTELFLFFKFLHLISLNIWNVFSCLLWIKHGFVDLQIIAFWFYLHFTQLFKEFEL